MVTPYQRGAFRERELAMLLRAKGHFTMRIAGSKGLFDLVTLHKGKTYLFQVKSTKEDFVRVPKEEIRKLVGIYQKFNPEDNETIAVYLAVKFKPYGWRFYPAYKMWSWLTRPSTTIKVKAEDGFEEL